MAGTSRLAQLIRQEAQAVSVRRDVSKEYACVSVFPNNAHVAELWIESPTLNLHLVLSRPQVALLACGSVQFTLQALDIAQTKEQQVTRMADRSPMSVDEAFEVLMREVRGHRAEARAADLSPVAN